MKLGVGHHDGQREGTSLEASHARYYDAQSYRALDREHVGHQAAQLAPPLIRVPLVLMPHWPPLANFVEK